MLDESKPPLKMLNLIMYGATSVETNIKWNGYHFEFFQRCRGIHQGDPILPYSFVLYVYKLYHIIMQTVEEGEWKVIKVGKQGPTVSHLIFVDDLLLFGEAKPRQMQCVMRCLKKFCAMSGEQVSYDKTKVLFSKM